VRGRALQYYAEARNAKYEVLANEGKADMPNLVYLEKSK
jgi:hypothetical protein